MYAGDTGTGDPGTTYHGVLAYYQFRAIVKTSDNHTLTDTNMGASVDKMEYIYRLFMADRQTDMTAVVADYSSADAKSEPTARRRKQGRAQTRVNLKEAAAAKTEESQQEMSCSWGSNFKESEPCRPFCQKRPGRKSRWSPDVIVEWRHICGGVANWKGMRNCWGCKECKTFCKLAPAPTPPPNTPTQAPTLKQYQIGSGHQCAAEYKQNQTQTLCMDWSVPTGCSHLSWKFLRDQLSGLTGWDAQAGRWDGFDRTVEQAIDKRCTKDVQNQTHITWAPFASQAKIICDGQPGFSSQRWYWVETLVR